MTEQFTNASDTTLNGAINNSVTTLAVAAGATFPSSGDFRIRIDDELIIVGARSSNTLSSLTRGAESTTAASHSNGATVTHVLTAGSLDVIIEDRLVAADVSIADAGNLYTTDTVEAALQQLGVLAPFASSAGASARFRRSGDASTNQTIPMGEIAVVGGVDSDNWWESNETNDPFGFFVDLFDNDITHKGTAAIIPADPPWAGENVLYVVTANILLSENPTSGFAIFSLVDADGGSWFTVTDPAFQTPVSPYIATGTPGAETQVSWEMVYALTVTTPPVQLGPGDTMYLLCDNTNGGSDCTIMYAPGGGNDNAYCSLGIHRVG